MSFSRSSSARGSHLDTDVEETELERSVGVGETGTADFEGRTTVRAIVGYVELDVAPLTTSRSSDRT